MSNFGRTEKIIFFSAVLALMTFSYFLYDDSLLFPQAHRGNLDLIGNVSISQNDVRRKNPETFAWLPANSKDQVFQSDSIFTGDRSEATVQLKDGSIIHVRSNSLITLNMKNGQMSLDLRYGDLEAELSKDSSLVVQSGSEEFKLEGEAGSATKSKVEFKKSHSKNVNLKLVAGKAKLNKTELAPQAAVSISQTGKIKEIPKKDISYEVPTELHFLRGNPDDPMPFRWKTSQVSAKYQLEISAEESFNNPLITASSPKDFVEVRDSLSEGKYFWRLKAYDEEGHLSATSKPFPFSLSYIKAPVITTPASQAKFNLEILPPKSGALTTTTQIQWDAMKVLENFGWQLSSDPIFSTILKEQTTAEKALVTPALESGTYFVRVRGTTTQGFVTPWSEAREFSLNLVAKKGPERPKAPILVSNKIDFKIPADAARNPAATAAPKIEWKPVTKSSSYIVQISKDSSFQEATRQDLTATSLSWSDYRPGQFHFRVYAKNPEGLLSAPSETGILEITSGQPILSPLKPIRSIGEQATEQEVTASWTEIPYAQKYLVEVSKNENFSAPTQFEYPANSGKIKIVTPGLYKVRVRALDESSKPLTEYSNVEELLYSFRSPLVTPILAEPLNNASVFLQKEMEPFLWLEWKKVKNAISYKLEISDRADFSKILISKNLPENRYLIKSRMPLGKVYWRVRAEIPQENEYSEWATSREFTIFHQKNEMFIK